MNIQALINGLRSSASTYTPDPRVALGHCILGCAIGYWSGYVRSSVYLAIERTFSF